MDTSTAWERFQAGDEPRGVRAEVLTSWCRSRSNGVDPEHADVPYAETELDTHFTRIAVPIMERTARLMGSPCLALADPRGSVTWRWVSEPMLRSTLDRLSVAEGFCWDEEVVGTNGLGTALETGTIAVVRGSEHFVHRFHGFTCVAAPVRHPITRRTVGAVNVTCRAEHTNPLLPVLVHKLVDEIRAALLDAASTRERTLLDAFRTAQQRTGGPVLTVGDDVVIANAAAGVLGLDHRAIWDDVRRLRGSDDLTITLPSRQVARVRLVRDGSTVTGAVLDVTAPTEVAPARPQAPRRWEQLVAEVRALAPAGPVAVRGEPGSGRATLLTAALGPDLVTVADPPVLPPRVPVLLRHGERLGADAVRAVVDALAREPRPFGVTVAPEGADRLLDALGAAVVTVPPLRRRPAEIAGLAQRELLRHGAHLTFGPDVPVALGRYGWPGNVTELVRVVRDAAADARAGIVGIDAFPPEVRAAASGRTLSPLERAESSVIAAVLAEHGGNKSAAAKELGISRTALYAKLRAYRL